MHLATATSIARRLSGSGFLALGGFHPTAHDDVPAVAPSCPTRTLLLVGSAGPSLWNALAAAPEKLDGAPNPLDRYTRRILTAIAKDFGLGVVFPFDGPPWHPFQRWALRVGGFSPSPLGVLAHGVYGPWAGFRAAFLSESRFGDFERNGTSGPCESCRTRPCLSACPAGALSLQHGYDVPRCRSHLDTTPQAACRTGCLARRACPVGADIAQTADQAAFHMRAFLGAG